MLAKEVYNSTVRTSNEVRWVVGTTTLKAIHSLPTLCIPLKSPLLYGSLGITLSSLRNDTTRFTMGIHADHNGWKAGGDNRVVGWIEKRKRSREASR
jgi:hypothetical protein